MYSKQLRSGCYETETNKVINENKEHLSLAHRRAVHVIDSPFIDDASTPRRRSSARFEEMPSICASRCINSVNVKAKERERDFYGSCKVPIIY